MKDLDFDELDKAVNSLIASTPGGAGGSDNTSSPVPERTLSLDPISTQQSAGSSLPTTPISIPTATVDRPGTGRFMDVVHPSSNMRTSLVMPERNSNPTPVASMPKVTPPISDFNMSANTNEPVIPAATNSNWASPTPPDVSINKDEDDEDINQLGNDIAKSLGQTSDDSSESPFLSYTKVEKRPLGAFSDELATIPPNTQPMIPEVAQPPMVQPVDMDNLSIVGTDTPLPAELHSDLLSLESDSTTQPEKAAVNDMPVVEKPQPSMQMSPTPMSAPATNPITTSPAVMTPVSASISQQYKEQPSTGDQNSGAIYDTNAYHKPMAKPVKKKSGWMWVLWIAILLIVGAGAGAAVYFFVLPR